MALNVKIPHVEEVEEEVYRDVMSEISRKLPETFEGGSVTIELPALLGDKGPEFFKETLEKRGWTVEVSKQEVKTYLLVWHPEAELPDLG